MAEVQNIIEAEDFPSKKSRSSSPIVIPEQSETKPSRKRGREISLEPIHSINGEPDQPKLGKDHVVPAKKNRTCDSPLEEESSSSSGSRSRSPKSPPREIKMRVRQLSQGSEDMRWQQTENVNGDEQPDSIDDDTQLVDGSETQESELEKGVKRKFLEHGTSAGPQESEGPPETPQENQKRSRDDPDEDPNPRETKRPTPPPESPAPPPKGVRSPPPSPKRNSTGFAAYSGSKSPFSKTTGNNIFGKSQAKSSPVPSGSGSTQLTSFAPSPNDINCTPNEPPAATPAKRSGFEAFVGSTSPFATFAHSKPPVFGSSKPKSIKRNSTPKIANAFSTYASGGAQAFTLPSAKRARADSPSRSDDGKEKDESTPETEDKPIASFGEKLRAEKDDGAEEDDKPVYEEQELTTGEEDENTVHQVRGKLFVLADTQWKERGVGQLRLNVSKNGSSSRLIMRKEAVHTVLLNVVLFPGMKCVLMQDPRYLRFSSLENGHAAHYNLKVSNAKIAQDLLDEIVIHIPESS